MMFKQDRIVQWISAFDFESEGRGFDSHCGSSQLRIIFNDRVLIVQASFGDHLIVDVTQWRELHTSQLLFVRLPLDDLKLKEHVPRNGKGLALQMAQVVADDPTSNSNRKEDHVLRL
ncbi:hypothetical protein V6N11_057228 [Hibiscus sabdariffa]|uniref:Uncharacterized protein n=1 Tax=Hibiscus sabdariffa TaxID=183260 RepID=A0ABR2NKJ3_9ROSI